MGVRRGSRIFERGGVQARLQDFLQAPPPLDIVRVTSSALRKQKIWKTPPLLDIHKHPPSLGHCLHDVIRPQKNWKTPPHTHPGSATGVHLRSTSKKGGGVQLWAQWPTSWPKRGGVRTPWTPPPGSATGRGASSAKLHPPSSKPWWTRIQRCHSSVILKEKKTLGKNTVGEIDCDIN